MNDVEIAFLLGFILGGGFGLYLLYIGIKEINERNINEGDK